MNQVLGKTLYAVGLSLALLVSACATYRVAGHSVSEVFPDPKVQELVKALMDHDFDRAKALTQQGADINYVGEDGLTPLYWVTATKDLITIENALKLGANTNHHYEAHDGKTIITGAAYGGSPELLQLLLKYGGDPNSADQIGETALMRAAMNGRMDNIKVLLNNGADINGHMSAFLSAPVEAILQGKYDIAIYLVEHGYNFRLDMLGEAAEMRRVGRKFKACDDRLKLFDILKAKGVEFPVFPRLHSGTSVEEAAPGEFVWDSCLPDWYPHAAKKPAGSD
ncbi:MAG: ankyrin repeat domain-containing protein [Gammaproteobacteria bacterium]|jgi:hypothetical protein